MEPIETMETKTSESILKKKPNNLNSIVFFAVVVIVTWGLFGYNTYLGKQIADNQTQLDGLQQSIREVTRDPDMQAYIAIKQHAWVLETLTKHSHVTKYIQHISQIAGKYGVNMRKYSQTWDKIRVDTIAEWNDSITAAAKSSTLIRDYRNDDTALFELWVVSSLSGYDSVKFGLNFTIQ